MDGSCTGFSRERLLEPRDRCRSWVYVEGFRSLRQEFNLQFFVESCSWTVRYARIPPRLSQRRNKTRIFSLIIRWRTMLMAGGRETVTNNEVCLWQQGKEARGKKEPSQIISNDHICLSTAFPLSFAEENNSLAVLRLSGRRMRWRN